MQVNDDPNVDELTAANVALDISALLDDTEPVDLNGPYFMYRSSGAPDECGDGWFNVRVTRNDDAGRTFRVTVEAISDTNWPPDDD